jgi:hypothetical protein
MTTATFWTGHCAGCSRDDVVVAPRASHGERVLCDRCASRPFKISTDGIGEERRRRSRRRAAPTLAALAETLAEDDLNPVIDEPLHLVSACCPDCRGEANDPRGLWRPLTVTPRDTGTTCRCDSCGDVEVRRGR